MPLTIYNDTAAGVNAAPLSQPQARPDKVDIDMIAAASGATGVVSGCAVTPNNSGVSLNINVAAGVVELSGTQYAASVSTNLTIAAANATNPRRDLVSINSSGTAVVTSGTAAATPCIPNIPATSMAIAVVDVPANATSITASNITDKRMIIGLVSIANIMPAATTLLFSSKVTGDTNDRFDVQTDGKHLWGSGSATIGDTVQYRNAAGVMNVDMVPGNAQGLFQVKSAAAGAAAYTQVSAASDTGQSAMLATSSTYTPSGLLLAAQGAHAFTGAGGGLLWTVTGADMVFATGGTATTNERFRIKNSGNVYIGSAATGNSSLNGLLSFWPNNVQQTGQPATVSIGYDTVQFNIWDNVGGKHFRFQDVANNITRLDFGPSSFLALLNPGNSQGLADFKVSAAGTTAYTELRASADVSAASFQVTSSTYTPSGLSLANTAHVKLDGTGGGVIYNNNSVDLVFAIGGQAAANEIARFKSTGDLLLKNMDASSAVSTYLRVNFN